MITKSKKHTSTQWHCLRSTMVQEATIVGFVLVGHWQTPVQRCSLHGLRCLANLIVVTHFEEQMVSLTGEWFRICLRCGVGLTFRIQMAYQIGRSCIGQRTMHWISLRRLGQRRLITLSSKLWLMLQSSIWQQCYTISSKIGLYVLVFAIIAGTSTKIIVGLKLTLAILFVCASRKTCITNILAGSTTTLPRCRPWNRLTSRMRQCASAQASWLKLQSILKRHSGRITSCEKLGSCSTTKTSLRSWIRIHTCCASTTTSSISRIRHTVEDSRMITSPCLRTSIMFHLIARSKPRQLIESLPLWSNCSRLNR